MEDKKGKGKSIFIRTAILVALFMLFIIVVLWRQTNTLKEIQEGSIDIQISAVTNMYSMKVENELAALKSIAEPIRIILSKVKDNEKLAATALAVLEEDVRADEAALLETDGNGVNARGESVYYDPELYMDQINAKGSAYFYLNNGEVAFAAPIADGTAISRILFLKYDSSNLDRQFSNFQFGREAWVIIADGDGKALYTFSQKSFDYVNLDMNIFESLVESKNNDVVKLHSDFSSHEAGSLTLNFKGSDRMVYYQPIGISDWYILIGVPMSYTHIQLQQTSKTISDMMTWIIAGMVLFLVLVILMSVMDKIKGRKKNENLLQLAETDQLTSLYNKVTTEKKIMEFIEDHPDTQSLMFVLDIDNFKKINDTRGHAFGDEVLRSIGHQVKALFRSSDIIGRAGGDEFIIFLKGVREDQFIIREAKKVEDFFQHFQAGEGYVKYSATASIGCAVFPRDAADFETLYKCADKALYTAKQRGKNQLAFFKNPEGFGQSV